MSSPVRNPSKRFRRAAEAERTKLLNDRRRLEADHDRLVTEANRVEDSMRQVDDQIRALSLMLGLDDNPAVDEPAPMQTASPVQQADDFSAARLLSGPAIREVAIRVLMRQPKYIEAIHYRRWYDLLIESGYAVAGKNPRAVFLTQLSRSPVIRKSSQAGVYEVDRQAPLRLRQRFERLQAELLELSNSPAGDGAAASNAARRRELTSAISRTEKALEEALRVLTREPERRDESDQPLPARLSA